MGALPLAQLAGSTPTGIDLFVDRRRLQRSYAKPDRKGPRSKSEIEKERREKLENAGREIDQIHDDYLARLVRKPGQVAGSVYCRYSTRFQHSIGDQVRAILQHALLLDIYVPRELIFFDLAVRGFKQNRYGLNQLEVALRQKNRRHFCFFQPADFFGRRSVHWNLWSACIVGLGLDAFL